MRTNGFAVCAIIIVYLCSTLYNLYQKSFFAAALSFFTIVIVLELLRRIDKLREHLAKRVSSECLELAKRYPANGNGTKPPEKRDGRDSRSN